LQIAAVRVAIRIIIRYEHAAFLHDALGTVCISNVTAEPCLLGAPVDVLFGFPDVCTPAAETECFESHRFQGDIAGENHQVGPRYLPAILLFDRPKQPASLVKIDIVGPTVEGSKALVAAACAAATVANAVGAGAVPCHANEQ